jgi:hypothetical protein
VALYKKLLKEDSRGILPYEAGISLGGYLVNTCKGESINLFVIDAG